MPSATLMHASIWGSGKCPGRNMSPNEIIGGRGSGDARQVPAAGTLRDDLPAVVDDLAAGHRRGRPAMSSIALVGAEVDRRVQRGQVDLHLAVDVDDHEIRVGA